MEIRRATTTDWDAIWPIFQTVVAAGDTYVYAPETSKEEARALWMSPNAATYVAQDEHGAIVGESRFRHYVNDRLMLEGGHIGYHIRPSARQKGYGTEILRLTLRIAKDYGLERVYITCDTDNLPSAKIIEKNRGVFDTYTLSPWEENKQVSRYWIDI